MLGEGNHEENAKNDNDITFSLLLVIAPTSFLEYTSGPRVQTINLELYKIDNFTIGMDDFRQKETL